MKASKSLLVTFSLTMSSSSWAFFTTPAQTLHLTHPRKHFTGSSSLQVVPPEILMTDHMDTSTQMLNHMQLLLSDAAVKDTVESGGGWWDNYLNLYKTCLLFVHDTIDQPLRNNGWDQTWGVSIAVFTAGTF
jgi:hypothetical protein